MSKFIKGQPPYAENSIPQRIYDSSTMTWSFSDGSGLVTCERLEGARQESIMLHIKSLILNGMMTL